MIQETPFLVYACFYFVALVIASTLLIRPIREFVYADSNEDRETPRGILFTLASSLLIIMVSVFTRWLIQLVILGVCVHEGINYWRDIDFNNQYKSVQSISPLQLLFTNPDSIPRYIEVGPVFPTNAGAIQGKTVEHIPIGEDYIYPVRLREKDSTYVEIPIHIFFKQEHDEGNEPLSNVPITVAGRYDVSNELGIGVRDIFVEQGYPISPDDRVILIEENKLPLPIEQTHLLFTLAMMLGAAQVIMLLIALRDRIDGPQQAS